MDAPADSPSGLPESSSHWSVSRLNQEIQRLLEDGFPHVRVRGEISGWRVPASGHAYFSLNDADSQIRAVIWRTTLRRLDLRPEDGMAVRVVGRIGVYPPRGEYQLVVDGLQGDGTGREREQLLRLLARLRAEG
ncbi:MAG: exodeoxyribonuclease VII large subunit, partial [Magnetococcus sp. WYHC-3]